MAETKTTKRGVVWISLTVLILLEAMVWFFALGNSYSCHTENTYYSNGNPKGVQTLCGSGPTLSMVLYVLSISIIVLLIVFGVALANIVEYRRVE